MIRSATLLMALVVSISPAQSREWDFTARYLPKYCRYTQGSNVKGDPEIKQQYYKHFGNVFRHMHHYCRGLVILEEASAVTDSKSQLRYKYTSAVNNFDYVLERSDSSFILRPEILVRKGIALSFLDRGDEAVACFREAIQLRPDYVPAYLSLGGYFARTGAKDQARHIFELGLEQVPDADILKRKLTALGE